MIIDKFSDPTLQFSHWKKLPLVWSWYGIKKQNNNLKRVLLNSSVFQVYILYDAEFFAIYFIQWNIFQ